MASQMEAARAEQEAILSRDSQSHSSEELQRLRGQNTAAQERIKALREDLVAANSAHMKVECRPIGGPHKFEGFCLNKSAAAYAGDGGEEQGGE